MAIRFDNIEAINLLNNQGEQTLALTNDQGIIVSGNVAMASGNATGKFAVKSAGVHASYDFYNDGTSYFNGAVTVDAGLSQTGGADATFSGIVGVGSTGVYAGTNAALNLPGKGIALKNDKDGSNNNWSYINNTATAGSSNINFATGQASSALTLAHNGNATFAGSIYANTIYSATNSAYYIDVNSTGVGLNTAGGANFAGGLQINNTLSVGSASSRFIWNSGAVSVTGEGTDNGVEIDWKDGTHVIPSLAYAFRVKLVTTGTGTDSGASYVVYYNNTSSSWVVRHVTIAGTTSNHPLLSMKTEDGVGTYMIAYHNHSSTYGIRYWVETFDSGDQDMDGHTFGSDFQWQRLDDTLTYEDGHVKLPDNNQLRLGAGNDLRLYHDGTHSYIDDQGTGSLKIRGSGAIDLEIADGSEYLARFLADDAVLLYHNGSKRFETSSSGVNITGDLTVSDVRTGSNGGLHLGDDSSILSIGRGNEIWTQNSVNDAATLYVNYRGYNGSSTQFRSLDIRDGKGGQIAAFSGSDKSVSFAGNVGVTGTIGASNFSGSSSGTNTGDQDLSGYLTSLPSHNHDDRYYTETEINTKYTTTDGSGDEWKFTLGDESNLTGNKWYRVAIVNQGSGGLHIKGSLSNHVESFGTQKVDLLIQGREANEGQNIEITGTVDVLNNATGTSTDKAGIRVIKSAVGTYYDTYTIYIRTTRYSQAKFHLTKFGGAAFYTSKPSVTTEPAPVSGGNVELDTSTLAEGNYVVDDSTPREIYHEGHKPTYTELGTMAYTNLTGTPTLGNITTADSDTNAFFAVPFVSTTAGSGVSVHKDANNFYYNPNTNNLQVGLLDLSSYGTAAAPAIRWSGDGDTGMYRSAANALSFSTSGTTALTLDASQNATFAGAVSTGGYLTLNAADNIPRLVFNGGGDDFMFSNTANYFGLYNDTDSRWDIQVDGAGNTTFAGNVTTGGDINVPEYVVHDGDTNTHIRFTADRIRLVAGGTVKFDSNSTYITSQRAISSTPTDGATTTAISSDWAFDNVKTAVPANAVFTDTVNTLAIGTTATTAMAGNTTIPSGNAVIDWTADQGSTNIHSGNYTNTTYSAGSGLDLTGTTFSIESDLRDGVTRIGKDTSNYIAIGADTNVIDFHVGGVWVARMESDGDLHMKGDVIAFSDIFNP